VGDRYARALFDLANETGTLRAVAEDVAALRRMRADSSDLRTLLASPAFTSTDKAKALGALAAKAKFSETTRKFLGLLAANGRASVLPEALAAFEVTTAAPMSAAQSKAVAEALRTALGKAPEIETRVDPALLGGIRVRVGSKLFDASLRSKLDSLKFALKRA
jgi:F-type H+-transporting ATPase subunit delta